MSPDEARARFAEARVARLATVGPDGAPHIVPITFALDGDAIVTGVDGKPKGSTRLKRLENLEANPRASVLVDGYDEAWERLWWARADGLARIVAHGPELERVISRMQARYPQYATVAIVGPAILVEVDRWTGWSASG